MRPEQNGLQGVGWAAAPDGVSQPPNLHPSGDRPRLSPKPGSSFIAPYVSMLALIWITEGRAGALRLIPE